MSDRKWTRTQTVTFVVLSGVILWGCIIGAGVWAFRMVG